MSKHLWKQYQDVATELLNRFATDFGLAAVEPAQAIPGQRSGTTWSLDAKGVLDDDEGIILVECRRYTNKKQVQEQIAAVAYRIQDTGARGAIIVSPLELQSGAKKVAAAENIVSVQLHPNSTAEEFAMQFFRRHYLGVVERAVATDTISVAVHRHCAKCARLFEAVATETKCPECASAA